MKRKAALSLVLVLLLFVQVTIPVLAAPGEASSVAQQTQGIEKVKLNKTMLTLAPNKKATLKLSGAPSNIKVIWRSSNPSVVRVKNGRISTVKQGKVIITATAGKQIAKCTVFVGTRIKSLGAVGSKNVQIAKGKSYTLKVKFNPANAINKGLAWSSSNLKVATVNKQGKVKAINKGTATITAKSLDNGRSVKFKVTVKGAAASKDKTKKYIVENGIDVYEVFENVKKVKGFNAYYFSIGQPKNVDHANAWSFPSMSTQQKTNKRFVDHLNEEKKQSGAKIKGYDVYFWYAPKAGVGKDMKRTGMICIAVIPMPEPPQD